MTKLYLEVELVPAYWNTSDPCTDCLARYDSKLCHSITCDDVDGTQLILVPASPSLIRKDSSDGTI